MSQPILLTICSQQRFMDEPPEETKLVTQGVMSVTDDVVELSYEETELTGLVGTTTIFRIEKDRVLLIRRGAVESKMTFVVGQEDRSLYEMDCGVLMIAVRTERIDVDLSRNGGTLCVAYAITIEDEATGYIEYQIKVETKEEE